MTALPNPFFMSAAEYLEWEPTQTVRYEYWDGEVVMMNGGVRNNYRIENGEVVPLASGADYNHNHDRILSNWSRLRYLLNDFDLYTADVRVQGEPGVKYFYPDVVVCERTNGDAETAQFPYLIVEVLSPSTEAIDRGAKFEAYRQVKSLQEYILVQVDRPKVEVFRRNDRNQWVLSEYDLDDRLLLESIGVEIAISDLYSYVSFDPNEWRFMI